MDTTNLQAGLEALTGYDFEQAENAERTAGNMTPDISFSKGFQARLAAKALGVSITDIKNLGIREYAVITTKVMNFLFANLAAGVQAAASGDQPTNMQESPSNS